MSSVSALHQRSIQTREGKRFCLLTSDEKSGISGCCLGRHKERKCFHHRNRPLPVTRAEKDWGITKKDGTPGDFTTIPNGCAGVENMYPYVLSEANKGRISFCRAVELCSTNPAKLFGLSDQKGAIRPGLDADIVIYDPEKKFTITNDAMHGDTDHTIWEGVELKGYPEATYSRGRLVYKDGEFLGNRGDGRLVKCSKLNFSGPLL